MDEHEALGKLTELLQGILRDDEIELTRSTTAQDVPGWDSLANVRFFLAVEAHFRRHFAAAEIARIENVGQLVDLLSA